MALSIIPAGTILRNFEQQARMAELNKKLTVKTVQRQVDRVSISPEARQAQATGVVPTRSEPQPPTFSPPRSMPAANPSPPPSAASKPDFTPMSFPVEDDEIPE
ncbi:hypothetical protein UZ36_02395 [Candidatus Nitromaritima sp. SCGC AAA799-C22]|nr:hypothetical protein UZ36_02395 [Candidatus Nitromaritima sp. SCGC AAA799-C22]